MPDDARSAVGAGLSDLLPRLWRFALYMSRDRQIAEDLVQATCLRALERAHQFAPGSRLDHWTFAILASILREDQRRHRRQASMTAAFAGDLVPDAGKGPEDRLLLRQMVQRVSNLPENLRAVAHLVYLEQYSCRETALILDIPVGTVLSRLAAARKTMAAAAGPGVPATDRGAAR